MITVNDYLARRDAEWMGPLLEAFGLTVGWITAESTAEERREAYQRKITYVSVNEVGFDYLRDQLVTDIEDRVPPKPDVALVDEADSILIDEARVPMVLAGTTHREQPRRRSSAGPRADRRQDYEIADDGRNVPLTDMGRRSWRRSSAVSTSTTTSIWHHAVRSQRRAARACAAAARRRLHRPRRRRRADQ